MRRVAKIEVLEGTLVLEIKDTTRTIGDLTMCS